MTEPAVSIGFNTQPPKGGWLLHSVHQRRPETGFNTQPPKGGWSPIDEVCTPPLAVSTHSRLKAAGLYNPRKTFLAFCFNTQPPKGGWSDTTN